MTTTLTGVVPSLLVRWSTFLVQAGFNPGINPDCIISFDRGSEEWSDVLRGPICDIWQTDEYDYILGDYHYRSLWHEITLADLRGSIALVHYREYLHIIDIWFLKDFDYGIWVKE